MISNKLVTKACKPLQIQKKKFSFLNLILIWIYYIKIEDDFMNIHISFYIVYGMFNGNVNSKNSTFYY